MRDQCFSTVDEWFNCEKPNCSNLMEYIYKAIEMYVRFSHPYSAEGKRNSSDDSGSIPALSTLLAFNFFCLDRMTLS